MPQLCENNAPECIENRRNVRDIMSSIKNVNKLLDSVDFKIDTMKEELDFAEPDYSKLQVLGTKLKPDFFKLEDSTEIDLNNSIDLKAILKLDLSGLENEEDNVISPFENIKKTKNNLELKNLHKVIKSRTKSSINENKPIRKCFNLKTNHIEKKAIKKCETTTKSNSLIDTSTYRVCQTGDSFTELSKMKIYKTASKPIKKSPLRKSRIQKTIKFGEVKKVAIPKPKINFILRNKQAVQRNRMRSKSEPTLSIDDPKKPKQLKTKSQKSHYSNINSCKSTQKKYLNTRPTTTSKINSLKKSRYRPPSMSARDSIEKEELKNSSTLQKLVHKIKKTIPTTNEDFEKKTETLRTRDELAKGDELEPKTKIESLPEKQYKEEAVQTLESSMSIQFVSKAIETENLVTNSPEIQAEESAVSHDFVESQATFVREDSDEVLFSCISTSLSSCSVSDDEKAYEVPSQFLVKNRKIGVTTKILRKEKCQTNRTNDSGFVDPEIYENDGFYDAWCEITKARVNSIMSVGTDFFKSFATRKANFTSKVVKVGDGCEIIETRINKKSRKHPHNDCLFQSRLMRKKEDNNLLIFLIETFLKYTFNILLFLFLCRCNHKLISWLLSKSDDESLPYT